MMVSSTARPRSSLRRVARRASVVLTTASLVAVFSGAKAAAPDGRFVLMDGDEVVHDTKTNLRWQRTATAQTRSWNLSLQYCTALTLAGGGFRAPNIKELLTIVDWSVSTPPVFPTAYFDGPSGEYWASSTPFQGSGDRHFVSFSTGEGGRSDGTSRYVRCVKP